MNSAFEELLEVARKLGMTVRHAHLGGAGGGLARFKNQIQLFVDLDGDAAEQLAQTAKALAGEERVGDLFIRPDVRQILDACAADTSNRLPMKKAPSPEGVD